MRLIWTEHGADEWLLTGFPRPEDCGALYRRGNSRWHAHAHVGGHYITHTAALRDRARKALEREIDRRSIGLLGTDETVEFEWPANKKGPGG